uniref:Uncharacterized protein n=1 Tax=Aegilops tauschii subsp. strangulata TaxID=200361 RepID=A0A453LGT3_AEGTS
MNIPVPVGALSLRVQCWSIILCCSGSPVSWHSWLTPSSTSFQEWKGLCDFWCTVQRINSGFFDPELPPSMWVHCDLTS